MEHVFRGQDRPPRAARTGRHSLGPCIAGPVSRTFASSLKLTFTWDGDKDISITLGNSFNVIVTNTEKIRIQKPTVRFAGQRRILAGNKDEEAAELANLQLQAIAALPHQSFPI